MTSPSTTSGTPSSECTPFSRKSGLTGWIGESSSSSITTGSRVNATRPAKPRPTGRGKAPPPSSSRPLPPLLEPLRGPGREGPAALLDEQHRGGIDPEEIRDAIEQLSQQVVEVEI